MNEEIIVKQCSPTLAGVKTGNIFMIPFETKLKLKDELRVLNKKFQLKGLRIIPLNFKCNRVLLYIYRPQQLKKDLANDKAKLLLKEYGYISDIPEINIVKLIDKFKTQKKFPHEIGLFLGYPPEDVKGFIENNAKNFKCNGCWKVYGDEKNACKTFECYKNCTKSLYNQWQKEKSIDKLIK